MSFLLLLLWSHACSELGDLFAYVSGMCAYSFKVICLCKDICRDYSLIPVLSSTVERLTRYDTTHWSFYFLANCCQTCDNINFPFSKLTFVYIGIASRRLKDLSLFNNLHERLPVHRKLMSQLLAVHIFCCTVQGLLQSMKTF